MAAGCGTAAARPRVDAAELGIARTRHTIRTFVMTKAAAEDGTPKRAAVRFGVESDDVRVMPRPRQAQSLADTAKECEPSTHSDHVMRRLRQARSRPDTANE